MKVLGAIAIVLVGVALLLFIVAAFVAKQLIPDEPRIRRVK